MSLPEPGSSRSGAGTGPRFSRVQEATVLDPHASWGSGGRAWSRRLGTPHPHATFGRRVRWRPLVMHTRHRTLARKFVPDLIIGPLLRHVGSTDATVWVETDAACEVEVLGCSAPTFRVGDHHYALIHVTGLEPGNRYEYEVRLDGERAWPEAGSPLPPSRIRTPARGEAAKVVFGSVRLSAPPQAPYTLD